MSLIPANPGLVACYVGKNPVTGKDDDHVTRHRVVAWDHEGQPMVVGPQGFLVRATSPAMVRTSGEFIDIDDDPYPDVVAVAPATNWWVEYSDGYKEPVIGWAVFAGGSVRPLTTDVNGDVDETRCSDGKCRVFYDAAQ